MSGGAREPLVEQAQVFSRQAVREVDRQGVERYGIPSIVLMENAAIQLATTAAEMLGDAPALRPRVAIFCGPGNNGGDGLAVARHLHNEGADIVVVLAGAADGYTGDAATNLAIVRKMGLRIVRVGEDPPGALEQALAGDPPALIVDALLGTGLTAAVREPIAGLIARINVLKDRGALVLAADIPSGLDCDTGEPLGIAVRADVTVSFVGLKKGFTSLAAQSYVGEVIVGDIGVPRELVERHGRRLGDPEGPDRPEDERHEPSHPPPAAPGRTGLDERG